MNAHLVWLAALVAFSGCLTRASRIRCQQVLRPVLGPNSRECNKDVSCGIYAGRAADAFVPKPRIRLRSGVYRANSSIGSVQWRAQPQGTAGSLAADDA